MTETLAELRKMSTDSLVKRYDSVAETTGSPGLSFYREEIARRENEKTMNTMLIYTRQMRTMTIVITALTVLNVLMFGLSLYFARR